MFWQLVQLIFLEEREGAAAGLHFGVPGNNEYDTAVQRECCRTSTHPDWDTRKLMLQPVSRAPVRAGFGGRRMKVQCWR